MWISVVYLCTIYNFSIQPLLLTRNYWLGPQCQNITTKAPDKENWVSPKLHKMNKIEKIIPFSLSDYRPTSFVFPSLYEILHGHMSVSKQPVMIFPKEAQFWCNHYHGTGLFWNNSNQTCSHTNPAGDIQEFLPYLTHFPLVLYLCVSESDQHWLR